MAPNPALRLGRRAFDALRSHLLASIAADQRRLLRAQLETQLAIGAYQARLQRNDETQRLEDAEFRVFSQWGEDGIIQHLIGRIDVPDESFVEFGVGDYSESNTLFLLLHNNWRGLILDLGPDHLRFVRESPFQINWRHDLRARQAFVTRENLDDLIRDGGMSGDIGLVSIDVDGNDYWMLEAMTVVSPRILVVEYNATFGPDLAVTIPYDATFDRFRAHASGAYWGASLAALQVCAAAKGYALVGSNRAGNNAFFVRRDVLGDLPAVDALEAFREPRFGEARDLGHEIIPIRDRSARLAQIAHLPLYDARANQTASVAELYGLKPA